MPLFQNSVLKKYLAGQDPASMHAAFGAYLTYFHDPMRRANIRASKEEQFQEGFLRALFVNILGYTINPDPDYNLTTELKNIKDSKKTDGAILKDGKAIAVIELKGTDTKDLEKIRDQAFNYKNNHPDCIYVITSNFEKLRFYIHNAVDYVEFSILQMQQEEFRLLWLLLQKDNLLAGIPQQIKTESLLVEELVTKKLYADYSAFKQELWQDTVAHNPGLDELLLYKKSQKLLDRFLFIFFAEDKGLLPPNSISEIVKQWDKLAEMDEYRPLYDRFKKYFGYMNTGRVIPGKAEIHAYNGGLFAPDELLDSLTISDALLKKHVSKLTEYDFESEVDTNILGHIFEHSLNDIENVRASLEGTQVDKSKSKRKKDGVFYTPKYITKYIVDNTVGKLCTEKKAELGIIDEEFSKGKAGRKKDTLQKLVAQLKAYREWLLQLAICDPACGSGAFLNQVLEFLMAEHRYLDELESMLFESSIVFPNVENHILENNIFGVDINEESVEIARLSLWLRTAQKGRKLSTLSSNIKVGNSLIDDPEVAGDLAFNWKAQFPKVFAKGGFDVVVGNPPYGASFNDKEKGFITDSFQSYQYKFESYLYFYERGIELLRENGVLSYITPELFLRLEKSKNVREYIIKNSTLLELKFCGENVFQDVKVNSVILTLANSKIKKETFLIIPELENPWYYKFSDWENEELLKIEYELSSIIRNIVEEIDNQSIPLGQFGEAIQGLTPYDSYRGHSKDLIQSRGFHFKEKVDESCGKWLDGKNVNRYNLSEGVEWLRYGDWLAAPREPRFFQGPRLLFREVPGQNKRIQATFAEETYYHGHSITPFILEDRTDLVGLLGVLAVSNSSLVSWYIKYKSSNFSKNTFPKLNPKDIKSLPVPKDRNKLLPLSRMAQELLKLQTLLNNLARKFNRYINSLMYSISVSGKLDNWYCLESQEFIKEIRKVFAKISKSEEMELLELFETKKLEAQALQSDIIRLDREIDALVYELYGLTEEEIRVVEGYNNDTCITTPRI
jgi:type I restriction-modification system DNA methylase subunit